MHERAGRVEECELLKIDQPTREGIEPDLTDRTILELIEAI